jgi:putative PIN family toxin of toxin-antitoxin system
MGKVKATLDTNVMLSIILEKTLGREFSRIYGAVELYSSEEILSELARVLTYQKIENILKQAGTDGRTALETISRKLKIVKTDVKINVVEADPSDNRILECAISSRSDYIVSGDKHLLSLKKFKNIKILSAREFLEEIYSKIIS